MRQKKYLKIYSLVYDHRNSTSSIEKKTENIDNSVRIVYYIIGVSKMEKRQGNIIVHTSGGTAGKGANTYKLTLPSSWMKELGVTRYDRQVELSFDGSCIKISRRLNIDDFIAKKRSAGHSLLKLFYYDQDILCSTIAVDMTDKTLCVLNESNDVIKTAFGNNVSPTWIDLQLFLENRCIPRARAGLREYLETLGIDEYEPLEIIKKTQGRMAEDEQWIRIEAMA